MRTQGRQAPPPEEAHPAYANNKTVRDWVDGVGQFANKPMLRVPVPRPIRSSLEREPYLVYDDGYRTLDLHTCWGHAPYVGQPFVYTWRAAIDDPGRTVTGMVSRQIVPETL